MAQAVVWVCAAGHTLYAHPMEKREWCKHCSRPLRRVSDTELASWGQTPSANGVKGGKTDE